MAKSDSRDEEIDGPAIVAAILNRVPAPTKERIVREMQERAPQVATKVETKLYNFEDLAELTATGIQLLLKEVSHDDLVQGFKGASARVQSVILANLSSRKQAMLKDDITNLPQLSRPQIEDAQRRIMVKLEELRSRGAIRTASKHDVWI